MFFKAPTPAPIPAPSAACYPNVKKIKLESTTGQPIQLFEIKAYSSGGVNVAKNAYATQSSTLKKFFASNSVDDDVATFSHTNDANAWLGIDFGTSFALESINIVNRYCFSNDDAPGCLCRLTNATLSLLDYNESLITSITLDNTCGQHSVEALLYPSHSFCTVEVNNFSLNFPKIAVYLSCLINI